MKANTYSLMRQCGIVPRESTENPVVTELLIAFEPLLREALAKGKPPAHEAFRRTVESIPLPEPAIPGMPEFPNAAAFLRSLQPIAQLAATYTPMPAPRRAPMSLESKVVQRDELGRIRQVETTFGSGGVCTSTARRDGLGRLSSILHEMDGQRFVAKVKRNSLGRISGQTLTLDGQDTAPVTGYDADTATINLLAQAIEDHGQVDLLHIPNRNPYSRAFVQRDAAGTVYAVNVGSQQFPVDQIRSPSTNVVIQFDAENRPYITIRGWKMVISRDFSGQVQALEPLDAED